MKEYVPVAKDCEHCSKKRGSFGCCSTVSNNWVYSCAEGQKEWLLNKIRAEIERLRPNLRPEQMTDYDYAMVDAVNDITAIIDKYKAESEVKDNENEK